MARSLSLPAWLSTTAVNRYPRSAAITARPKPVFLEVNSMMWPPFGREPSRSAAVTMLRAILILADPVGLNCSSFRSKREPVAVLHNSSSGVLPTRSETSVTTFSADIAVGALIAQKAREHDLGTEVGLWA